MPRTLILGNAGSGKSTLARRLASTHNIPHLDLDSIAWADQAVRRPLAESIALLHAHIAAHPRWVIEGCYGDLIAAASPHATELHFLRIGTDACIAHCRNRTWEPHKYPTREAQDQMLPLLIDWVRQYDTRDDEFGLARHQAIFDAFPATKHLHASPPSR